jgi:hypothetical protein
MYGKLFCACVASLILVAPSVAKDPKDLFNGKDLSGWEGDTRVWSVEDGAIVGKTKDVPLKENTFLIWKDGKVADFNLTVEYKLEGGNSGIQYRSKVLKPETWVVGGYQADMDGDNKYTGILYEERGRGIVAQRGQKVTIDRDGKKTEEKIGDADKLAKAIKNDGWNTYVVQAHGGHLVHKINGKIMSDTTDRERDKKAASGILALQVHANLPQPMVVRFRKIQLEELESQKPNRNRAAKSSK